MTTIVILDDSATNRSIYARLASLVEPAVTVEAFGDPEDALEWLAHNRVDLVITDFKMPGMDGASFTRALRASPHGSALPVLVVTAHDDRGFRVQALDAGATDFLQSPVDHFEFVTRARNLLTLGRGTPGQVPLQAERLLAALPVLICATDRGGRALYMNAAFASHSGGAPWLDAAGQDNARQAALAVLESGQPMPMRTEAHRDQDGKPRLFLTGRTPLHDAEGVVVAVVTTSVELPCPWPQPPDHAA